MFRPLKKSIKRRLKPAPSKIHGKGLFTTVEIKKGTVLGVCKIKRTLEPGPHTIWLEKGPYDVLCRLKYINHNSEPNVSYFDGDELTVVALRNISPGEELTHHYGEEWD